MKFNTRKPKPTPAAFIAKHFAEGRQLPLTEDHVELLVSLVGLLRPGKNQDGAASLKATIQYLEADPQAAKRLSDYIKLLLSKKRFNRILSDAAILQDVDFLYEVRKRIYAKVLPNQPQKDTLDYVLSQVFYRDTDAAWVNSLPLELLEKLFEVLDFQTIYDRGELERFSALSEVLFSMSLLSQRSSGRAMETDVMKMVPEYEDLESPFAAFEQELQVIEDSIRQMEAHHLSAESLSYRQLEVLLKQSEDFVDKAFANSSKFGISMRVNQNLLRIRQQLQRLKGLLPLLAAEDHLGRIRNTIYLARQLITFNCYKNNVRKFFMESTQLISYEITQHTAKTGEHYITETRREYFRMFRAALGGGLIVGVLCLIKVYLGTVQTSFFGHAFLYSMNYAFGFILIFLFGFTLATKQPAMTASALIRSIEQGMGRSGKHSEKHEAFAIFFARVFRSQFIAFVGNVVMAFPVSLLGVWAIDQMTGDNMTATKWPKLLTDISPLHSPALFHAAIAGVFLFLSGIISGSIANRDKHNQVYFRIEENPLLKRTFGKIKTKKLARWYEKRWAGIVANFWFGVFMGSTVSIGLFLGLNLDVRHITFASGNLALALYGAQYHISNFMLFWGIFGIAAIGLVNFLVSFSLSLGLAFRSRNIPFTEVALLTVAIWQHFKKSPLSFFFPTEKKQKSEAIANLLNKD